MPFIAENDLEKALVAAAKDSSAAVEFYRLLLESDLLMLGTVEGQEDTTENSITLAPNSRLKLIPGMKDGIYYLPVFSSLTRMQEYIEQESKYLRIKGREILEMTRGALVILNPASPYGKELSPQQVQQLLDGASTVAPVRIDAMQHPENLVAPLRTLFATRPDIEAAWMVLASFSDGARRPLVGIELDSTRGGDWSSLMQAIQATAESAAIGVGFDIERVDTRNPTELTNAFLQTSPFYQRRPTGFPLN
jgi:hypothetical protein